MKISSPKIWGLEYRQGFKNALGNIKFFSCWLMCLSKNRKCIKLTILYPLKWVGTKSWLFGFYGILTFVGYLMSNPFLYKKNQFYFKWFSLAWVHSLIIKTLLFQAIQFSQTFLFQTNHYSINMQFSSIWPIDITLSGATTPSQSGPGSDANEGVLCILQSSSILGMSPSDCLESYQDTHWHRSGGREKGDSYPSAEVQSVYSTAPADWTRGWRGEIKNKIYQPIHTSTEKQLPV